MESRLGAPRHSTSVLRVGLFVGRRFNPRLAKSLRCYTIIEVAELYRVHRNTVRHWLVNGLALIDGKRPLLIHGDALNNFHRARRVACRQACGPAEIYCFGCRKPRRPARDIADLVQKGSARTLIAICPDCDSHDDPTRKYRTLERLHWRNCH